MKDQRIIVTGGTGFAGSHLIEELLKQGYQNIYSTTFSEPDSASQLLPTDHYVKVDLSNEDVTNKMFEQLKPDWVFHLASFAYVGKSFDKAKELFTNNINLQLNVLEAIKTYTPQARVLTIGSAEEYGMIDRSIEKIDESVSLHPVNPYAVSKVTQDLLAESYYLTYKLQIVRCRPFNHIGTKQSPDFAIPAFAKQIVAIEKGEQQALKVGSLEAIRDFTSVQDVVRAYILLMEKGEVGQVYNIGSGIGIQMKTIVEKLIGFSKTPITIETDPSRIRPLDAPGLIADNRKMSSLGWQPEISIDKELQNVLEEWRKK
ncbi:MAG: GDP-mannose 4,6-dehydratase [Candidatus Woesebacteria bacterium]